MSLRAANAAAADRLDYEGVRAAADRLRECRRILAIAADGGWSAWADAAEPTLPDVRRRIEDGHLDGEPPWLAIDAIERDEPEALADVLAAVGAPPPPRGVSRGEAALHAANRIVAAAEGYVRAHWHEPRAELVSGENWRTVCECWPVPFEGTRDQCERMARGHVAERDGALREALARAGR